MTTNSKANFPNISVPFVDKDGRITAAWQLLLINIWNKTQSIGNPENDLPEMIAAAAQEYMLLNPPTYLAYQP